MEPHRYLDGNPDLLSALARVEILYTDLDGTLVGPGGTLLADSQGAPSTATAAAVVDLNLAGLPIVIVSGRSVPQLIEVARLLGWKDFIAETGAVRTSWRNDQREVVVDTGSWPPTMPAEGRSVHDEILAIGAYDALVHAFPGEVEHHDPWHLHREATLVLRGCIDVGRAQSILNELPLALDLHDNGLVRRRSETLSCTETLHAYHVVPRGVSKRRAIELDLAERGLASEQAAIIGDSPSDLAAAPAVGLAVLVGNALEQQGLADAMAAHPNAALLHGGRGDGWAELARLWLEARTGVLGE